MKYRPRTLTTSQEGRLLAGLLLPPFVAGGAAFVLFPFVLLDPAGRTFGGSVPLDPAGAAFGVALFTGMVAFFVTLLLALPAAVWLLLRRGAVSWPSAALSGLAFGALAYAVPALASGGTYGVTGAVRGLTFTVLTGLTSATAFWAVALRDPGPGRPG